MKIKDRIKRSSEFKSRLKEAMSIRQKTQSDLVKLTGIPKSAMSQYLSGNFEPKTDRLKALANALDVSEPWLRGYDVPMGNPQNHFGYEENPRELELCDYYDTLSAEEQEDILQYVKDYANGKLKANSPGEQELSEGEQKLLELFRQVSDERKEPCLRTIEAVLETLK